MSFGTILFGSIVGTMIALREELSGQPYVRPASLFPPCSTEKQVASLQRMRDAYEEGDYADSIRAAEKLMKIFPNCPYLYMYRGMCYGQTDRFDEAIEDFMKALSLDNASDAGKTYWLGHNRQLILGDLQLVYHMKGARDRAIAEMKAPESPARRSGSGTASAGSRKAKSTGTGRRSTPTRAKKPDSSTGSQTKTTGKRKSGAAASKASRTRRKGAGGDHA